MILDKTQHSTFDIQFFFDLFKTLFIIAFSILAFAALVELKKELQIDIFPNIDTPFDDFSALIFGK